MVEEACRFDMCDCCTHSACKYEHRIEYSITDRKNAKERIISDLIKMIQTKSFRQLAKMLVDIKIQHATLITENANQESFIKALDDELAIVVQALLMMDRTKNGNPGQLTAAELEAERQYCIRRLDQIEEVNRNYAHVEPTCAKVEKCMICCDNSKVMCSAAVWGCDCKSYIVCDKCQKECHKCPQCNRSNL